MLTLQEMNCENFKIKNLKDNNCEDQQKFIIPLNRETEKIWYDLRFIIDAKVLTEPRTFKVSKVNRVIPNGLVRVTLAQDLFNEHTDFIEKDEDNKVVAMWADYYTRGVPVTPVEPPETKVFSRISYAGVQNQQLRIGANYKKFTVSFFDESGSIAHKTGFWEFKIDDNNASKLLSTLLPSDDSTLEENQIKLKFIGDDSWIGKDLTVSYTSDSGVKSEVVMNIIGM